METYQDLMKQRACLDQKIQQARERELGQAIKTVQQLITSFQLRPQDVFPKKDNKSSSRNEVKPKYFNPATGATWSGRGKEPKWIQNAERERFLILK